MGRRLNHATPTVVNTELIPFDESFFIGAEGQLEQWYYDNTTQYAPNRRLSPLILTPHLSIFDKETGDSYSSDAESTSTSYVPFYTVMWYALEYVNDGYVESVITNLTDSADADYVISGNSLIVKKNVSYSHGVTIRCVAAYKDPRDANNAYTTQETVLLTTNRDAKVDLPEVSIISPSARGFNPLTDYKTVDGVEVQDSLFDFEAVVSNKPTVDPGVQYRVDGGGTEEIVEEEGVMTALPSMDIRYPDSDVMLHQSFLYRVTANGTKPNVNGGAFVTAMRGNTVKFNQILTNGDFSEGTTGWVANASVSSISVTNGILTITKSSTNINGFARHTLPSDIENHALYVCVIANPSVDTSQTRISFDTNLVMTKALTSGVWEKLSTIKNVDGDQLRIYVDYTTSTGSGTSLQVKNVMLIDLTFIFGTDDQIAAALGITTADITTATGVAAFETWLETNLGERDYYPYDAGSLVPTRFSGLKTVGFNLWDGTYSAPGKYLNVNGELVTTTSGFSTSNFIKVLPETNYYISAKSGGANAALCFYDSHQNYISGIKHASIPSSKIFTTPASARYIKTTITSSSTIINISDTSKNGTYAAYWDSTTPLAITSITGKLNGEGESVTVFPDGMKRIGNVYDEIKVEGGVLKAIKRVHGVDLGTLTWNYNSNGFGRTQLPSAFIPVHDGTNGIFSQKYILRYGPSYTYVSNLEAWLHNHNVQRQLNVRDDAYTTAAEFKTAMNGVIFYYELDTPQEYILDPVQDPCIFEWFGMNGSQEVRVETLPWYVSGQGTSHLTVDAMFGEHINVVATAKSISGQPTPSKAYAAVEWRVPDMDINVMSKNGGAVRSDSTSFDFEPICNMNGTVISDTVKSAHLRFNWKYRKSNSTVENDLGWGSTKTIAASNLLNTKTVSGTLPSTHVYSYAYLLGAWEVQTSTDPVPYSQPTTTKDGVTYVRKVPTI